MANETTSTTPAGWVTNAHKTQMDDFLKAQIKYGKLAVGEPKASEVYTVTDLKAMLMVGLYRIQEASSNG